MCWAPHVTAFLQVLGAAWLIQIPPPQDCPLDMQKWVCSAWLLGCLSILTMVDPHN